MIGVATYLALSHSAAFALEPIKAPGPEGATPGFQPLADGPRGAFMSAVSTICATAIASLYKADIFT